MSIYENVGDNNYSLVAHIVGVPSLYNFASGGFNQDGKDEIIWAIEDNRSWCGLRLHRFNFLDRGWGRRAQIRPFPRGLLPLDHNQIPYQNREDSHLEITASNPLPKDRLTL